MSEKKQNAKKSGLSIRTGIRAGYDPYENDKQQALGNNN